MTTSNTDVGRPKRQKVQDESVSNLVGPEDPERGNPPSHKKKDRQSQGESVPSKDISKDDD
jgi:hypothetical protein